MKDKIEAIAKLLQEGKGDQAKKNLRVLLEKKVPREHLLSVARLIRRTNNYSLAVKLLNPIIRPTGKTSQEATDEEKAEYAASLTFVGATEEAFVILNKLDKEKIPQALLFEAYALFAQWDYKRAIPLLKKYLASSKVEPYQKLVGKVNLAAALVYERINKEAGDTLSELLDQTSGGKYPLLYSNALELSAQNHLWGQQYKQARKDLENARNALSSAEGEAEFYIRKWEAFLACLENGKKSKALSGVGKIREEAYKSHYWESVRDCDRFICIYNKDSKLLTHLYFGTPFDSFKERLLEQFGKHSLTNHYDWQLSGESKTKKIIDVVSGEEVDGKARLRTGQLLHSLLSVLSSDFYQPTRLAVAHHKLYPKEFFNPQSSPHQVHEIVRRLKEWFKESKIPLSIEESSSYYRLVAEKPVTLRVSHIRKVQTKNNLLAQKLKELWPKESFTVLSAAKKLKLSHRSASRLLLDLVKDGNIERRREGLNVLYFFVE